MIIDENYIMEKVLYIGPDYKYPSGGIAKVLSSYSKIFKNFKSLSTTRRLTNSEEKKIIKLWMFISSVFCLVYEIVLKKKKIIHIHTASGISFKRKLIFLNIANFLKAKTILHIHSGSLEKDFELNKNIYKKALHKSDRIIVIADYWKKFLVSKGFNNVAIMPNPLDKPKDLNILDEEKDKNIHKILFLGLICENKGVWDIIKFCIKYKLELEGKVKILIGGNGESIKLIKLIKDNNLMNIINYLGWVNDYDKPFLFNNVDIYIQPSYYEALGIGILEAMSYKLPVIASYTGGIPEIVKNNVTGILISPGNIDELYQAINKLLLNKDLRITMGINGYNNTKIYYEDNIKQLLLKLYNNLLNYEN